MDSVLTDGRIPAKLWTADIDHGALEQTRNLTNLPFAFKHIAVMPDAHLGYGMPIGGVLATQDVVIPNAVGVDIGCGVCAADTGRGGSTIDLKEAMGKIRQAIPVGFKHRDWGQMIPPLTGRELVCREQFHSAQKQIGTLGGGNHFIEFQISPEGNVWVMIHSGSRNLGYKVAGYYNKLAQELNARWFTSVPKDQELAFLPLDTPEGKSYMAEMTYCVEFARANRAMMMDIVLDILSEPGDTHFPIDVAHNYAAMENHFGKNVMVHRKGATRARKGEVGIIPGSQGTSSYILEGRGNPQSFMSCSHGAGRRLGRKQAKRELSLETEQGKMAGIIHSIRHAKDLDEAPGAYKDIDEVMAHQEDLVSITTKLTPLGVIKG